MIISTNVLYVRYYVILMIIILRGSVHITTGKVSHNYASRSIISDYELESSSLTSSIVLLRKDVHVNHFISLPQSVLAGYNGEHNTTDQGNDCNYSIADYSVAADSTVEVRAQKLLN